MADHAVTETLLPQVNFPVNAISKKKKALPPVFKSKLAQAARSGIFVNEHRAPKRFHEGAQVTGECAKEIQQKQANVLAQPVRT